MKTLAHYALSIGAAVALLAGCGGSQPTLGIPGAIPHTRIAQSVAPKPNNNALLYVSDQESNKVFIYSYPDLQLRGTITGLSGPSGLCIDPATQNVWVANSAGGELTEFKRGGSQRIRKLHLNLFANDLGCAVDAVTGDLAVVVHHEADEAGGFFVFKNAHGKPKAYDARKILWPDFVAYDSGGDAFVDGNGDQQRVALAELTPGAKNRR